MFDQIKTILDTISGVPNVLVYQELELVLEPSLNGEYEDYQRRLKFQIIKIYDGLEKIIYKANCKENNPKEYLEKILNDLTKIQLKLGGIN